MSKTNLFLAGIAKSGTTWLYHCFDEHPEILVPDKDAIHYFNLNYHKGDDWYHKWFQARGGERIICDPTPSYMRGSEVAARIHGYNPEAKFLFALRNPVERAFSHYWHQKRKGRINFEFTDVLYYNGVGNYDLYDIWIRPGFYNDQLTSFFELFNKERIKVVLFDHLKADPSAFLSEIWKFLGVEEFTPAVLQTRINSSSIESGPRDSGSSFFARMKSKKPTENEYEEGIPEEFGEELKNIYRQDISNLQKLIDQDLSHWL